MRLSDHFLAARGGLPDLGGFATHMAPAIQEAQRFEIADDVALAVGSLLDSKPSTLAAALPLCRLPYPTMWLEWRGGLGPNQRSDAPIPVKQGVLIESMDGQVGHMTFGWVHHDSPQTLGIEHAINISPLAVYFDWRPDSDVRQWVRVAHDVIMMQCPDPTMHALVDMYREHFEHKYLREDDDAALNTFFTKRVGWTKLVNDRRELESLRELDRHVAPGLSPHGIGLIAFILNAAARGNDSQSMLRFMRAWERDVEGEGVFVECFLAMLNSKNPVVEHVPADLSKLNKARKRSGKPPFLPYAKTRLTLSRSQARIAAAHGINREAARQHLVRGHFKIRRTGVFWWSPFLRGDASQPVKSRENYEVVK